MALILGIAENDDFFCDDVQVIVTKILNNRSFMVRVVDGDNPVRDYRVDDRKSTTIRERSVYNPDTKGMQPEPIVSLQAGSRGHKNMARVMVTAPKRIEILRGFIYRKSNGFYTLSDNVRNNLTKTLPGVTEGELLDMLKRSAIATHSHGNRRYDDIVFRMDGKVVESIFIDREDAQAEREGKNPYYDDCPVCDGAAEGCSACDGGQVIVGYSDLTA